MQLFLLPPVSYSRNKDGTLRGNSSEISTHSLAISEKRAETSPTNNQPWDRTSEVATPTPKLILRSLPSMTQMPTPPPISDSSRGLRFRAVNDPIHEQDPGPDPAPAMDDIPTIRGGGGRASGGHGHRADAGPELTRRAVGPRLYHKKSRMGCLRCKARRVKCDEAHPVCSGCSRHMVECVYPSRGAPSQGSSRQDAAAISLRVTRAESSSGHSDQGFSPNASSAASTHPGSDSWASRTPGPEPHSLPVPVEPGGFSPMTPGYTPYSANRGLSPPHFGGYPPSGASGGTLPPLSSRAASVVSSSSSSQTGSIVREANDYLSHLTDPEILDIPESKERRIWELRLLHNYMVNFAQQAATSKVDLAPGPQPRPSPGAPPEDSSSGEVVDDAGAATAAGGGAFGQGSFLWGLEIPLLAFEDDAILYSMLASSALNMWTKSGDARERDELRMCQQKYLSMALREQRQAVGNLSRDNADTVCMSSLTILQNSFALVQTLPVRPWQPPLEWLRMGKGAGSVLTVARGYLGPPSGGGGGRGHKTTQFLNSMPRMDPDEMFTPANRAHLEWVLDNDRGGSATADAVGGGDHELQDKVTLGVYNRVLSYIGTLQRAIADGEPLSAVCRRFIGFAVWMPEVYHDFLTQRRPRALVTLAHFFKLWIPYDDVWLIGKTGENQVRGIREALPPQWRHKVDGIFEEYHLSVG